MEQNLRNGTDRGISNPQTLWKTFKNDIREMAQKQNKESRAKITKRMNTIRKDMDELTNHPNLDTDINTCYNEAFLANKLAPWKKSRQETERTNSERP